MQLSRFYSYFCEVMYLVTYAYVHTQVRKHIATVYGMTQMLHTYIQMYIVTYVYMHIDMCSVHTKHNIISKYYIILTTCKLLRCKINLITFLFIFTFSLKKMLKLIAHFKFTNNNLTDGYYWLLRNNDKPS